ncbi:MAG: hypothetical protein H8E30_14435 [Alphaproteobacteria bacterium]|nr:hypothetical protein [Alphaproteobacteria bacterium]
MARTREEDIELRECINVLVRAFNEYYRDWSVSPDQEVVQEIGEKLSYVWNTYFSGGRIEAERDRELLAPLKRIPLSDWPDSIALEVYTDFTQVMGWPVVALANGRNLNEKSRYLRQYASDVTSQSGEDGILKHIFQIIGADNEWCVEFGAWDGKEYSNTYTLVAENGWNGVLIEAQAKRFKELEATYRGNDRAILINAFVGFDAEKDSIDYMLAKTDIPTNFDLIIIDIDGNDWHVWNSMQRYRPRVVVIEHNPTVQNDVIFIQELSPEVQQGCSLRALIMLGKSKGYELICTTNYNAIFVVEEEFSKFGIADNSIDAMHVPLMDGRIFHCYDTSVHCIGMPNLIWDWSKKGNDWASVMPDDLTIYER